MSIAREEVCSLGGLQETPSVPDIVGPGKGVDELMRETHKAFLAFIGQAGSSLTLVQEASPLARRQYDESVGGNADPDDPWWNQ